jgi:isopentenyl phosphate kinase
MKVVCLKLGGGFLTHKSRPFSFNHVVTKKFVETLGKTQKKHPNLIWLIGTGAGSFGHYVAKTTKYHENQSNPLIVAKIHQSVVKLNTMVVELLNEAGIPGFSLAPSSFMRRENNKVIIEDPTIFQTMLNQQVVPVVFGDVILDKQSGTSIISTEDVLDVCARQLKKDGHKIEHVIYITSVDGVLNLQNEALSSISRRGDVVEHRHSNFDVTGGIKQKVEAGFRALDYTENVHIINGNISNNILSVLDKQEVGTRLIN